MKKLSAKLKALAQPLLKTQEITTTTEQWEASKITLLRLSITCGL